MEHEGKTRSPYKGVLGSSLLLIGIPILLFIFVYLVINKVSHDDAITNLHTSLMFGFGCGFLFQLTCVLSGLFKGTFKVVKDRVKTLFENLAINFKFAMSCYWEDIKSEGVVFWIYFLIIGSTFGTFFYGFIKSFMLYLNYK